MEHITLGHLAALVEDQGLNDRPIMIFLHNDDCHMCHKFIELVTPFVEEYKTRIEFYIVPVDFPPLFAPGVLPSFVGFAKGVRTWEGLGYVDDLQDVVKAVKAFYFTPFYPELLN